MSDQKPPFGKKRRNLPKPQVRVAVATPPAQKRSALLSPGSLGTAAAIGVGALVLTNGFGSGGSSSSTCTISRVATSAAQCEALAPGAQCGPAFAVGATVVGMSRTGSGPWTVQPLTAGPGSAYRTMSGQMFNLNSSCRSTSSSRRSGSYFWGGSSAGRSSSGYSSSQSQGVSRSGFGSTARSFSSSSSRGG